MGLGAAEHHDDSFGAANLAEGVPVLPAVTLWGWWVRQDWTYPLRYHPDMLDKIHA